MYLSFYAVSEMKEATVNYSFLFFHVANGSWDSLREEYVFFCVTHKHHYWCERCVCMFSKVNVRLCMTSAMSSMCTSYGDVVDENVLMSAVSLLLCLFCLTCLFRLLCKVKALLYTRGAHTYVYLYVAPHTWASKFISFNAAVKREEYRCDGDELYTVIT